GWDGQGRGHAHRLSAQHHRRGGVAGAGRRSALIPKTMLFQERRAALEHVAQAEGRRGMKPMKLAAALLATAIAVCTPAAAQEQYPSRLITVVVPLTAGKAIGILALLFSEGLMEGF